MPFVQWIHYVAIGLFIHQIHRTQSGPAFTSNSNVMQSLQIQSGRNIRRLPCIIHRTGAEGVCMFSIDCIKANGTHLGTCHDRFYIGSCCKLKDDADVLSAEIVENNIESSTTSETLIQRTTSKWLLATKNPAAQRTTTTQSTSTKASTSTESQTSKIVTEQNATVTTKRPGWIIISNVLSLSSKDSVTARPTSIVSQSTMNSVSTRFPTRKPQSTSTVKPTTAIPTTTDEMFDLTTEFDRSDEITTVSNVDDTTTIQFADAPTTTEYQSETSTDGFYETTTVYDTTTEYEMDFTTEPAEENNENTIPNSTDETMQPMPVTNAPISISFKEEDDDETTPSMLASTTEPVSLTIAHSPINLTNTETSEIEGSSTTKTTTTEFMSTTEEIATSTSIVLNGLEKANYKQICGRRLYPQPRIVGGSRSSFGRWPWQISLRQWHSSSFLHKCGAALLNENWAITAAHCVDNVSPADLLLRLGEFDIGLEEEPYSYQDRRVQIVVSYPQFDARTFEYDLALMRLHEPVIFQPNIIPVCMPETDDNFIGRKAFVTGWGRLYEDGPLPSVLQEVPVPIINNTLCEGMYRQAGYDEHIPTNSFICAGYKKGGRDSCEGDSGGPLVIQREDKRFLLAGVISWGINCAEPNQPGVYTRISQFREWINQIIQI